MGMTIQEFNLLSDIAQTLLDIRHKIVANYQNLSDTEFFTLQQLKQEYDRIWTLMETDAPTINPLTDAQVQNLQDAIAAADVVIAQNGGLNALLGAATAIKNLPKPA